MYRARHVSRECRRPPNGGSVALGGSLAPLDGPVRIRPPPWTGKCYQIAVAIAAIMSAETSLKVKCTNPPYRVYPRWRPSEARRAAQTPGATAGRRPGRDRRGPACPSPAAPAWAHESRGPTRGGRGLDARAIPRDAAVHAGMSAHKRSLNPRSPRSAAAITVDSRTVSTA